MLTSSLASTSRDAAFTDAAAGTVLLAYNHLQARNLQIEDSPQMNGVPFAQTAKGANNQRHITVDLDLVPGDSFRKSVDVEDLTLGVDCLRGSVSVLGSAAFPTAYVSFRNVEGVLPTIAYVPNAPYLSFSHIGNLEVDGFGMERPGPRPGGGDVPWHRARERGDGALDADLRSCARRLDVRKLHHG